MAPGHATNAQWCAGHDPASLAKNEKCRPDPSGAFGTGEVDLVGLFGHRRSVGYTGDYVVEMEVRDCDNTLA